MSKVKRVRSIRLVKEPKSEASTYMVCRTTRGEHGEFHAALVRANSVTEALDIVMNSHEYTLGYWKPNRMELVAVKLDENASAIVMQYGEPSITVYSTGKP